MYTLLSLAVQDMRMQQPAVSVTAQKVMFSASARLLRLFETC